MSAKPVGHDAFAPRCARRGAGATKGSTTRLGVAALARGRVFALCLGVALGCARTPPTPPALAAAHAALLRAQLGPARDRAPAGVARAEVGFATARAACARDPGASSCRDWCYVVEQRAEQARVEADVALAHEAHHRAHLAIEAHRARAGGAAPAGEATRPATAARGVTAPATPSWSDRGERDVHRLLEASAPRARAVLAPGRGVVVRLADGPAFVAGSDRLLPQARLALRELAHTLQGAPLGRLAVGARADATDARGLARVRAHAVVAFLIGCGLPATTLRAEVLGGDAATSGTRSSRSSVAVAATAAGEPSGGAPAGTPTLGSDAVRAVGDLGRGNAGHELDGHWAAGNGDGDRDILESERTSEPEPELELLWRGPPAAP